MRRHGAVATVSGLGASDHVCWTYENRGELVEAALTFFAEGLAGRQRLLYVTGRSREQMHADLAGLPSDRLLATGGLLIGSIPEMFDLSRPIVPEERLAFLTEATEQAVADGYAGLRIVADVTDLVAEPWRRPAYVRWEHLAQQFMGSGHPVSAICAYDRRLLGTEAVADLAAVHPLVHGPSTICGRLLFFDGDRLVLAGAVDSFSCGQIRRLLDASRLRGGTVVLDVEDLEFIDARGMLTLVRWAQTLAADGGRLVIEGVSPLMRRAWSALGFDGTAGVRLIEEAA